MRGKLKEPEVEAMMTCHLLVLQDDVGGFHPGGEPPGQLNHHLPPPMGDEASERRNGRSLTPLSLVALLSRHYREWCEDRFGPVRV